MLMVEGLKIGEDVKVTFNFDGTVNFEYLSKQAKEKILSMSEIEKLRFAIAYKAKEKMEVFLPSEWNRVEDSSPEAYMPYATKSGSVTDFTVLVCTKQGIVKTATFEQWDFENKEKPLWHDCSSEHFNINNDVTHWMNLPRLPIQKEEV